MSDAMQSTDVILIGCASLASRLRREYSRVPSYCAGPAKWAKLVGYQELGAQRADGVLQGEPSAAQTNASRERRFDGRNAL